MPFMKASRAAMYADFQAEGAYINYKRMKLRLHEMRAATTLVTPDEFYEDLVEEKERLYAWCERKVAELSRVAAEIACQVAPDIAAVYPAAIRSKAPNGSATIDPETLRLYADAVLYELLRFQECRNFNTDCIEQLLGRQQRYTVLPPTRRWHSIHDVFAFQKIPLDEVFYLLQRIYGSARHETNTGKGAGKGLEMAARAGQEFDRRSVKYWVHEQDLPFVIGRVIQHLPLNVYHDNFCELKSRQQRNGSGSDISEWVPSYTLGAPINSVYFDNADFLFYHRRLQRLEGSSILRARWYESAVRKADTPNHASETGYLTPTKSSPSGSPHKRSMRRLSSVEKMSERMAMDCIPPDGTVFMELKVHHEAWSGAPSTKRRFPLKNSQVNGFIRGEVTLNTAVDKLESAGCRPADIAKFKHLVQEVYANYNAYELRPVLRTTYSRCAFQQPEDFSIRVSIDTDVATVAEDFGSGKHWRYIGPEEMQRVPFPYAIVEVKLQFAENERMAPWIEELCSCRLMEAVPKFSKYAHGMASLYGRTSRIHLLPYWFHQLSNEIRAATKLENDEWDHTAGLVSGAFQRLSDYIVFGTRIPQTRTVGASEAQFLGRSGLFRVYQTLAKKTTANDGLQYIDDPPLHLRQAAYKQYAVYASVQRQALRAGGIRIGGNSFIPWQSEKRVRVPQKFDPKTIFTSERYFLKWVHHAVITAGIALASIHFGGSNTMPVVNPNSPVFQWHHNIHIYVGVILMAVAQLMLLYALMVFHARSRRVYARTKISFDDVRGPTWLTIVLAASIALVGGNYLILRFAPIVTHDSKY